jgi:hypothetical protein
LHFLRFYVFFWLFSFMLLAISHAENTTKVVVNEYIKENVWRTKLFSIVKKNTNLPIQIVFNKPKIVASASNLAMQKSAYKQLITIKDFLATHFPKANIQLVGIVNNDIKQYFIEIVLTE